ncbi:MAG: hypothetical protein J6X88_05465 [Bacteroidales bacterium]|nr:hypothetical protein [Bacteroidales bacterium]
MKKKQFKKLSFTISFCWILFFGCHGGDAAKTLLRPELLQEIRGFREDVEHDIHDDFVKKCISSIESTSTMIDIRINDFDTIVGICLFDSSAPCNKGIGDYDYKDCLIVNDGDNKIFISDKSNLGILYNKQLMSKIEKEEVNFTDGISRYYYYRNGSLIPVPSPKPSDEVVVIDF